LLRRSKVTKENKKAMKKDLLQAYKQAPWRTQVQWVGIFLLIVVAVAAVAGLYLFISGRSAATGRRIQNLESEVAELQRQNNDLQTQLGEISSSRSLNERVESLNMRPLTPNEAIYLEVPGYIPPSGPSLAPPPSIKEERTPILLPEFTDTFIEWISSKLKADTQTLTPTEVQP
jgi:cell division protein FtsL